MELEGKVWKSKKFWLVEVPSLDVMTQGETKREALEMICDLILELTHSYLPVSTKKDFNISVNEYSKGVVGIVSTNNRLLFSLVLKRQREKSQTSVRKAASRLGSDSPNAYSQYEQGRISISLDKCEKLLQAANPDHHSIMRVI